jgi:hypothetical protein
MGADAHAYLYLGVKFEEDVDVQECRSTISTIRRPGRRPGRAKRRPSYS